ncbi:hypothetical protein CHUAL_012193 [Chamberlinius hualienensis]
MNVFILIFSLTLLIYFDSGNATNVKKKFSAQSSKKKTIDPEENNGNIDEKKGRCVCTIFPLPSGNVYGYYFNLTNNAIKETASIVGVVKSGDLCDVIHVGADLNQEVSGVHDVTFKFKIVAPSPEEFPLYIDYFMFLPKPVASPMGQCQYDENPFKPNFSMKNMKSPLVIVLVYLLSAQGDPGLSRDSSSENTRHFVRSSNFAKKSEFDEEKEQVDDPKKQTLDLDWFSFSRDLKSSTCSSSNKYRNSDTIDDHDAIEQRFYNEPIVPNLKAVEQLQCDNYFKRIEAESFNKTNFAVKKTVCGETVASNLTNGTYLAYDQVDFGNVGIDVITLNFLSENETQVSTIIEIYLDKIDGFRLAKFQLNFIGIKCQFYLFKFNSWPTWGVHDMFIKFTNLQPSAPMNLDWIDLARDLRKPECPEKILILPVRGENVFPIFDVLSTK